MKRYLIDGEPFPFVIARSASDVAILLALALVLSLGIVALPMVGTVEANPGTIYVPDDHPTIQQAVDNASSNDIIIVRDGNYHENVYVNVANLTIKSENGTANCVVSASNSNDHVFEVTQDYGNITGFTVENATGYLKAGIYLNGVGYCNISNNIARNNTLTSNNASNNTLWDFYSDASSHDNTVEDLTISSYPTTISFTYDNGVKIKGVKAALPNPAGEESRSEFASATPRNR